MGRGVLLAPTESPLAPWPPLIGHCSFPGLALQRPAVYSKTVMLTASEDAIACGSHAPHRPRRHRASARIRSPPGWPNSSDGLRTLPPGSSLSNGRRKSQWWIQARQTRISIPSPPIPSAPQGTRGCHGRYPEPRYPYPPSAGTAGTLPLHTFSQSETSSRSRPQKTSSSPRSPTMTRFHHQPKARRLQRPLGWHRHNRRRWRRHQ